MRQASLTVGRKYSFTGSEPFILNLKDINLL